jgi:hypothetical protein
MVVIVRIQVFLDVTICSLVCRYMCFTRKCFLHLQVEVCRMKNLFGYTGKLQGMWSLGPMVGGDVMEASLGQLK